MASPLNEIIVEGPESGLYPAEASYMDRSGTPVSEFSVDTSTCGLLALAASAVPVVASMNSCSIPMTKAAPLKASLSSTGTGPTMKLRALIHKLELLCSKYSRLAGCPIAIVVLPQQSPPSLISASRSSKGVTSLTEQPFRVVGSEPLCSSLRALRDPILEQYKHQIEFKAQLLGTSSRRPLSSTSSGCYSGNARNLHPETSTEKPARGSSGSLLEEFSTSAPSESISHLTPSEITPWPNLPVPSAEGVFVPLEDMSLNQLRQFVPAMLKMSVSRGRILWQESAAQPPWWPVHLLPWANIKMDQRSSEQRMLYKLSFRESLCEVVRSCYRYYGQSHLLLHSAQSSTLVDEAKPSSLVGASNRGDVQLAPPRLRTELDSTSSLCASVSSLCPSYSESVLKRRYFSMSSSKDPPVASPPLRKVLLISQANKQPVILVHRDATQLPSAKTESDTAFAGHR